MQVSQNRLVRLVLGMSARDHVGKLHFQQLGWLPLAARSVQLQLNLVHNIYINSAPVYLCKLFQKRSDAHSHLTRASIADLTMPTFTTEMGKRSFRFGGAVNWNSLPLSIKNTSSHLLFKIRVKAWLLENVAE